MIIIIKHSLILFIHFSYLLFHLFAAPPRMAQPLTLKTTRLENTTVSSPPGLKGLIKVRNTSFLGEPAVWHLNNHEPVNTSGSKRETPTNPQKPDNCQIKKKRQRETLLKLSITLISFNTILCVRCFTCPIKKYARAGLCPWKLSSGRNSRCHKIRTQKKKKRFTAYLFIFSDRKEKEKKKKEKKHATNYELSAVSVT